jgi:hypothetical protein
MHKLYLIIVADLAYSSSSLDRVTNFLYRSSHVYKKYKKGELKNKLGQ